MLMLFDVLFFPALFFWSLLLRWAWPLWGRIAWFLVFGRWPDR